VPISGGVEQRSEQNSLGSEQGWSGRHASAVHSMAIVLKQPPVSCP
jgi:hypothetical protein